MFVEAEDSRSLIGRVAADSLKHRETVLHRGTHERNHTFAGGPQGVVDPYKTSGAHSFMFLTSVLKMEYV
jgi:hypothetical protein